MRSNLITLRKKKGYTQKELANLIGITENYYQKLEYGSSTGNILHWFKLKEILHTKNIDYLIEQD